MLKVPWKTIPWKTADESGRRPCECLGTIFQARGDGQRHHHCENILRHVQRTPDDISWVIDQNEFDEHMATMKESALGRDGIQYSFEM